MLSRVMTGEGGFTDLEPEIKFPSKTFAFKDLPLRFG
jgi:hypothetical protein